MANHVSWSEDYWLPLMQLYLKKPEGVKPIYSRALVDLALQLHITPKHLYNKMFQLRQLATPMMRQLWDTYATNPAKLARNVKLLRKMHGFGNAGVFYDGVQTNATWEKDFLPVDGWEQLPEKDKKSCKVLMPISLILILDLYFRLTPNTMAPSTPEIIHLGKLIKVQPALIVTVMRLFLGLDPYISQPRDTSHPLFPACHEIWNRYGNQEPEVLAALAAQLKEYF